MTKLHATDRILAARPGDPTTILNHLDTPDDLDRTYVRAMKTWCAAAGIDPFIALTQWAVETANGTSVRWVRDHNPGGVGIPADSTVQPFEIANGDEAARIHVQALYACVTRKLHPDVPVPIAAQAWFDGVWLPKVTHSNYPGVTIVDDLNTRYTANGDAHATWAWDAEYVTTLINRCALFYPDLQPQGDATVKDSEGHELNMTPGLIPEAGYADRLIPDANNSAWDNLGQRVIRGVTLHRMLGGLEGTDTYFRNGAAGLTDMGAKASSDLVYRWNDETGKGHQGVSANRAPWASGPYRATAYGDGLKFTNKYGVNAVNRDRRSLEIDGFYADAWSKASMQEYAQTTAHDAHNYGITWEQFPYSPKDDCSFICWHNEFCGTDYKECPGSVVMNQTDEFIGIVKGIMKAAQQGTVTPPTPTPTPPPPPTPIPVSPYPKGATEEWVKVAYGSIKVPWAAKPFAFDITRSECRAWLAYCTSTIPRGGDYTDGHWGALEKVVRRGNKGSAGRDFLYSHGFVYHQEPRAQQKGPAV
jgi:hypothetical protein